jgi:hypothetical protein
MLTYNLFFCNILFLCFFDKNIISSISDFLRKSILCTAIFENLDVKSYRCKVGDFLSKIIFLHFFNAISLSPI